MEKRFFVHAQGEPGNEARLDLPVFHHWTYTHQEFITVKLFRKTYFGVLMFSRHHHKPTEKIFLDACNCTAPIIVYCVATVQFQTRNTLLAFWNGYFGLSLCSVDILAQEPIYRCFYTSVTALVCNIQGAHDYIYKHENRALWLGTVAAISLVPRPSPSFPLLAVW